MEETKQQKVKQSPSLQSFKNAIRNLDISGILENNCDCCDLCRSWFYDFKIFNTSILRMNVTNDWAKLEMVKENLPTYFVCS